jgi:hypothetical protein
MTMEGLDVLDGRIFDMVSSTASVVSDTPTRFAYSERDGVVWGEYRGDTVTEGRFCGRRDGETLRVAFVHRSTAGALVSGDATSVISRDADGLLVLTEDFAGPDGSPQVSVCREIRV